MHFENSSIQFNKTNLIIFFKKFKDYLYLWTLKKSVMRNVNRWRNRRLWGPLLFDKEKPSFWNGLLLLHLHVRWNICTVHIMLFLWEKIWSNTWMAVHGMWTYQRSVQVVDGDGGTINVCSISQHYWILIYFLFEDWVLFCFILCFCQNNKLLFLRNGNAHVGRWYGVCTVGFYCTIIWHSLFWSTKICSSYFT